jgi:hypothetical protein
VFPVGRRVARCPSGSNNYFVVVVVVVVAARRTALAW